MSEAARLVTAEEFARMPEDDLDRYELVEGRLVPMSPVNFDHGRVVARLLFLLQYHLQGTPVGVVATEVGFKLASNPDTVRGPDVAFIKSDRLPSRGTRGFLKDPPDAVIEVLSPDDLPSQMRRKVAEYLAKGVAVVVVVDPGKEAVTCHRPGTSPAMLRAADDLLDLGDVIAGFHCRLREIFESHS
jgi:Uma2 family endonuclease